MRTKDHEKTLRWISNEINRYNDTTFWLQSERPNSNDRILDQADNLLHTIRDVCDLDLGKHVNFGEN
tara:strand:+ start:32154 stop:32354 length:201 start_codon:yes stop_codon:yes gene_type:complete